MSLFAGLVFARDPEHVAEASAKLFQAFADFRPDPLRVWKSEGAIMAATAAGLARRPLTVPESGNGDVPIVATTRLDRIERLANGSGPALVRELGKERGAEALLVKSYLRWGERCAEHLDGDFAFALLDQRSGRFFAARDRLGVFPFYYFRSRSGLYFANNMRILRSMIGALPLNLSLMVHRIQGFLGATDLTMLEGVFRLPGGHTLQCDADGGPAVRRYWSYDDLKGEASSDFHENAERLRTLLIDSTQRRLPDSGNIGVELSGGLDSTAVAGAAALTCRDRLYSYSAVFPDIPEADDSALIQAAAHHHRIRNETFDPVKLDILKYFDDSLLAHGDFHDAGNIHINMRMLELARQDGCRTILDGIDGDNIASPGLYRLTELANAGRWWEFGRCATAVADIYSGFSNLSARDMFNAWGQRLLCEKAAKGAFLEILWAPPALAITCSVPLRHSVRRILAALLRRPKNSNPWKGFFSKAELNHDTLEKVKYADLVREMSDLKNPASEREAKLRIFVGGVNEHCLEFTYSISAKQGISKRSPFMDRELMEFCFAVPAEHKLRDGWTRAFLRHGMGDIYPPEIAWQRRKSNLAGGLDATIRSWCLPAIEAALGAAGDPIWQFFDPQGVRVLLNKAKGGDRGVFVKIWMIWAVSRCLSLNQDKSSNRPNPILQPQIVDGIYTTYSHT